MNHLAEAVLTSTHNLCFEQKYAKYQFLSEIFQFFGGDFFCIFEKACFRNANLFNCLDKYDKVFRY